MISMNHLTEASYWLGVLMLVAAALTAWSNGVGMPSARSFRCRSRWLPP